MALRKIRTENDEVLHKKAKEVMQIDNKLKQLVEDMTDTMYKADGIGLAAPQVGILKRVVVIDTGEGLVVLINPVIVEAEGEQCELEGCLSVPDRFGEMKRPARVKVEALDLNGKKFFKEGTGLLARAFCHELDHLDGVLFPDKALRILTSSEVDQLRKSEGNRKK